MAKKEIKKQTIDCIIWDLVDNLRKIRAEEKRAQTYLFYNEEGIPIQSSLPVLAKDESDARNTMKLLSFGCIEIISIQRNG